MSMNKKILLIIPIIILTFTLFIGKVNAAFIGDTLCGVEEIFGEEACLARGCIWKNNKCVKPDDTKTQKKCSELDKEACNLVRNCKWTGADCIDNYVAADPCNEENIQTALRFVGYLLMIAKIAIPLIIIVVATFDLFKSVIDKDEKSLGKQVKIIIMRIVAGIFVFFLPTIVYALFNLSAELKIVDDAKYQGCATCLLKPTECKIEKTTNN